MKLSIAYFGTPDFAAYFLEKLLKENIVDVQLVVTQPDKPVGRKQIMTQSPVKVVSQKFGLEPLDKTQLPYKQLKLQLKTIDIALVYAYGEMIPRELLELPKYGFWNIHPSLLPKYRGPSPVAQALIDGEKETGVTIIKLDEKMDHGPIIAQEKLKIGPKERRPELTIRLTDLAYEIFKKVIRSKQNFLGSELASRGTGSFAPPSRSLAQTSTSLENFIFSLIPQEHDKATYTKILKRDDGYIEISNFQAPNSKQISNSNVQKIFNRFRGLYPWPGLWTTIELKVQNSKVKVKKRLKITDMELVDGKLIIKKVQLEGKKEVDFKTFNEYYKVV